MRAARRDGREPMGLGVAIGALVTERAWELPAAGGTLRERWAAIAPELAGHVAAVAFAPDSAGSPCARSRRLGDEDALSMTTDGGSERWHEYAYSAVTVPQCDARPVAEGGAV
ncbi:hypothetical protein [Streptomyces sp. NPDC002573]|uniref:hypothetical protein n=1 Tax=Streptomyces sp. NPDC002573 TaxID=3364651 RepID=UPI0036AF3328